MTDLESPNEVVKSAATQQTQVSRNAGEIEIENQPSEVPAVYPVVSTKDTASSDDPEEDAMDMSRSDIDEGEIDDDQPPSFTIEAATDPFDDADTYEPPIDIEPIPQEPPLPYEVPPSGLVATEQGPTSSNHQSLHDDEALELDGETNPANETAEGLLNWSHRPVPQHSPSPVLADESDDYEPPEPALPLEPHPSFSKAASPVSIVSSPSLHPDLSLPLTTAPLTINNNSAEQIHVESPEADPTKLPRVCLLLHP